MREEMESSAIAEVRRAFKDHSADHLNRIIQHVTGLARRANVWRVGFLVISVLVGGGVLFLVSHLDLFGDPKNVADKWVKATGAFLALWSPLFAVVSPKIEFKSAEYEKITGKIPLPVDLAGVNRALALPTERFDKVIKLVDAIAKALAVYLLL